MNQIEQTVKCVINGEEVLRPLDYFEAVEKSDDFDSVVPPLAYFPIPVLEPGEEIVWVATDERPHIIKVPPTKAEV